MELIENLNPEQKSAVLHTEGPLLILAGAGSGKTRVITYRIAYLVREKGVNPANILAVTFTNKAANEMKERIGRLVGNCYFPYFGTFHSVCVKILRKHGHFIGFSSSFTIYDDREQQVLIKGVMEELELDIKKYSPRSILSSISRAKNNLVAPSFYEANTSGSYFDNIVFKVYSKYQEKLKENQAMDFDDLLVNVLKILQEVPEVYDYYSELFKYIHVDEYQDVNRVQYQLVKTLSQKNNNICVVGDDDQSIYAFRGADVSFILEFEKDFPNTKIIKLEQNYRSTEKILDAANAVVKNNTYRKEKALWTEKKGGSNIIEYVSDDEYDEARFVAGQIKKLSRLDGFNLGNFAVLYRTNAQSRVFEEVFLGEGLPYKLVGGIRFYDRKEIKDILSYLLLLVNPYDSLSLKRIINVPPRGIGNTSYQKICNEASQNGTTILDYILNGDKSVLPKRVIQTLNSFADFIRKLNELKEVTSLSNLVKAVIELSGYKAYLEEEHSVESLTRLENVQELISVAMEYDKRFTDKTLNVLDEFLCETALLSDIDMWKNVEDAVTFMTLHSAKGLEFPVVFITGLEEGILPHSRSLYAPDEMDEERRLCYVGITRAMDQLYLTIARKRTLMGNTMYSMVSRFRREIPDELVEEPAEKRFLKEQKTRVILKRKDEITRIEERVNSAKDYRFKKGDTVLHKIWSKGIVTAIKDDLITVEFPLGIGQKTIRSSFLTLFGNDSDPDIESGFRVTHRSFGKGIVTRVEKDTLYVLFPMIGEKEINKNEITKVENTSSKPRLL